MRRFVTTLLLAGFLCSVPVETAEAGWWSRWWRKKRRRNPPPPPSNPNPPAPSPDPSAVPEINAGSAAMGCAILFGVTLMIADRRRRAALASTES